MQSRLPSLHDPKPAALLAELRDAEHLADTGDMTKQALAFNQESHGTRAGDPGHYEIDSTLVDADGTVSQAIQTYQPVSPDVDVVILGARAKSGRQRANAPVLLDGTRVLLTGRVP